MSGGLVEAVWRIQAPDEDVARKTARLLDTKTKPPGSLGQLEDLACRLAAIRGEVPVDRLSPAIVVAAADHGVVSEGVSPYPQAVTGQMLANFAIGGAAVAVLAREAGARLVVVDAGVIDPPAVHGVRSEVVDEVRSAGNIAVGPAMAPHVALEMIDRGAFLANELADDGIGILAVGDMGIGNTTAASALCAALLPADPLQTCGPGTGLDEAGVARKVDVVRRALVVNALGSEGADPLVKLISLGGLE
ncbi:MAG: nicotinate-nucleotide--dimethylbenzimidazole phosphoribosyltransferase, partial [Actinomycetota bacterium]|nr:nicotinate-nucleotide--dimethylbenzimidazole phosphoribosyltransferase [Actinomycetota bacterium]